MRPDDRLERGAERTLPPEDLDGADRTFGALDRDGPDARGARLGARCGVDIRDRELEGARLIREEPELRLAPVTRLEERRCGIVARERDVERELEGARLTRDEPDERLVELLRTRLLLRCGMVACERDVDRELDGARLTRDWLDERFVVERLTRLVDRVGAVDEREPERTVDVPVVRLVRPTVEAPSPRLRQPLLERVVACEPLRTVEDRVPVARCVRLTEVVPAAPPRTMVRLVERFGDCAPLRLPRVVELVERTEPPLASCCVRKLRTELTTC